MTGRPSGATEPSAGGAENRHFIDTLMQIHWQQVSGTNQDRCWHDCS
jgi:hypothetical protein